ncbi:MAG: transcriptional repressor [Alphaproteobacteria bacterium]|nr:transcriptional repressor [Alphaproteobacteria bacterium]
MTPETIFPGPHHDHGHCVAAALDAADGLCARRGVRLTTLRRRVLELVWGQHEPVGAYLLLEGLKAEGRQAAPPTVYRALDFLLEQGLIHRIAHLNAFVGCRQPELPHTGQFLVCRRCGIAAEMDDSKVRAAIEHGARAAGFTVHNSVVEIEGVCARCQESAGSGEKEERGESAYFAQNRFHPTRSG